MSDEFSSEDWSDEGWSDDEPFNDDNDETQVVTCPNCAAEVYEDAEQCPECGEYITPDTSVWSGRPLWYITLGLAGMIAVIVILSGLIGLL